MQPPSTLQAILYLTLVNFWAGKHPMSYSRISTHLPLPPANSIRRPSPETYREQTDSLSPRLSLDLELGSSPRVLQHGCVRIWIFCSSPICRRSARCLRQTFARLRPSECARFPGARGSKRALCSRSSGSHLRIGLHDTPRTFSAVTSYVLEP